MAEKVEFKELLERYPWLTERRLRSWVSDRRIPHWRVAGRLLFDPDDVDALVEAGYVPATTGT